MVNFLKITYIDLNNRIRKLKNKINARSTQFNFDVSKSFVQETLTLLETLEIETLELIDSGALNFELLMPNNLYRFNSYVERYEVIDSYRADIILKYDIGEQFFNRLLGEIYQESSIVAIPKPIVSLTSNSIRYYSMAQIADVHILAIPRGEEESLLQLPDLYHEIAHLLCLKYRKNLLKRFFVELNLYFLSERTRIKDEKVKVDERLEQISKIEKWWQTTWVWELACDSIATYLVGPAFGWTALKLNTNAQGDDILYRWKPNHPPDAARIFVVLMMLDKLGLHNELKEIQQVWAKFLTLTNNPKPKYYNSYFPEKLLDILTTEIYSFCDSVDLTSISTLYTNFPESFAVQINEAWLYARSHQNLFDIYERKTLETLRIKLGLIEDSSNLPDLEDFGDLTQL